jgi:hypothetical protein
MTAAAKPKKIVSDSSVNLIQVLKGMSPTSPRAHLPAAMTIPTICERSAIADDKELIRYLYILEGQKLVSPCPPGDFTAKEWTITDEGLRALKVISQSMAA